MILACITALIITSIIVSAWIKIANAKIAKQDELHLILKLYADHFAILAKILKKNESNRGPSDSTGYNKEQFSGKGSSPAFTEIGSKPEDEAIPVLRSLPRPAVQFGSEQ